MPLNWKLQLYGDFISRHFSRIFAISISRYKNNLCNYLSLKWPKVLSYPSEKFGIWKGFLFYYFRAMHQESKKNRIVYSITDSLSFRESRIEHILPAA